MKTIKLLGENVGTNLHNLGFDNGFLNMIPKTQATKEKNKLYFIKLRNFCTSKDTTRK